MVTRRQKRQGGRAERRGNDAWVTSISLSEAGSRWLRWSCGQSLHLNATNAIPIINIPTVARISLPITAMVCATVLPSDSGSR